MPENLPRFNATIGGTAGAMTRSEQDALSDLDERIPTWFYWQLTLLATVGGFLFDYLSVEEINDRFSEAASRGTLTPSGRG
jgi:hypothetical protein